MSAIHPSGGVEVPAVGSDNAFQKALTVSLVGLGIFLPFSTAGTSIFLSALVLLALSVPRRIVQLAPWRDPVIAIGLALLAWIALRIAVEPASLAVRLSALNRYHELLMVPLLWCLLRLARNPLSLWRGLLAGTFVYAAAYWVVRWIPALGPWLESRRISGGLVFSVCAFLLFEYARTKERGRWLARAGALFLLATALFFSDGRTGHLLALLMLGFVAWRAAPQKHRLAAALLVILVSGCVALTSATVRHRITETLEAARADQLGEVAASSTGYRIQVWRIGGAVAREHALTGTGWAGYRAAYEQAAGRPAPAAPWARADNPHNEYLMQLGAGGIVALGLFLAWIGLPLLWAWRRRKSAAPWPPLLACVTIAFAVGCLFNSLLLDFAGGHFHAAVLAWLLARQDRD